MVTEEEIAELMKTPEGMQIFRSMMDQDESEAMTAASDALSSDPVGVLADTGDKLRQIGASPNIPGATRGLSPAQIGASPVNHGATRGLPPEVSGINPEEENQRRRKEMELRLMGLRNQYGM